MGVKGWDFKGPMLNPVKLDCPTAEWLWQGLGFMFQVSGELQLRGFSVDMFCQWICMQGHCAKSPGFREP